MKLIPAFICVTLVLICSIPLTAQDPISAQERTVPPLIKFTGALKDVNGLPRVGTLGMSFRLYATQEGGEALWTESQVVATDERGQYTVYLGASENEGIPLELFSSERARWLGVQVQGENEQTRFLFVAVPYALKAADAETIGGRSLSSFVLYEDLKKIVQGTTIAGGSVSIGNTKKEEQAVGGAQKLTALNGPVINASIDGSGSANALPKFASSSNLVNSAVYEVGGNVGVGITGPTVKLEVGGAVLIPNQNYFMTRSADQTAITSFGLDGNDKLHIGSGNRIVGIQFDTGGASGSNTMYVTNGSVGIGTSTPSHKLEVSGNVKATGIVFPDSSTLTSAIAARTRGITYLAGCDTCSVLADADDQRAIYINLVGPMTINSVICFSDAGTPTINLRRDSGTLADVLSSDLTCSTSGATSSSIVPAQSILGLDDKLDFVMVSAGGVGKRVTVAIKATVN